MQLTNKVAVVTGAARGIGASIAEQLVARGCRVVLADIREDRLSDLAKVLGSANATAVRTDVSSPQDWKVLVDLAASKYGPIDVLVNNAGIVNGGRLEEVDPDMIRAMFEVNVLGAFLGIGAVVGSMRSAGGGSIVNIASIAGTVGVAGLSAYSASKWAVRGLTKSAAVELGPDSIRVNAVLPGGIDTPMLRENPIPGRPASPLGRLGMAADIAHAVCYLASDESAYCTGAELVVDGGRTAGMTAGAPPS